MKKISIILIACIGLLAIIFAVNGNKNKIIGTWYYENNPERNITINKNNTATERRSLTSGGETYNYTFEDKVLTFYSYGVFPEHSYYVEVKGNKMYWEEGDKVIILCKSYENAHKEYEKQQQAESERLEKEREEKEERQEAEINTLRESMPDQGDAELALASFGYNNYRFVVSDEFLDYEIIESDLLVGYDIDRPTVIYHFDIEVDGEIKRALVRYCYDEYWFLSGDIEFEEK